LVDEAAHLYHAESRPFKASVTGSFHTWSGTPVVVRPALVALRLLPLPLQIYPRPWLILRLGDGAVQKSAA
jgi:hypothetical protein